MNLYSKNQDRLKQGILIVFFANAINLIFKLLTNFLMPRFLNIDAYADFKYYQMLVIYIGVLHLGFNDGFYLKIGGKDIKEVDKKEVGRALISLVTMQFFVSVIILVVAIIQDDYVLMTVTVIIVPTQIINFYKYVYQATGEFLKYGRILNLSTIMVFLLEMLLLIVGIQNAFCYMGSYTLVTLVIWIILLIFSRSYFSIKYFQPQIILTEIKTYVGTGIFIMLGNFAITFLTGMDRWFIKKLMNKTTFAHYSFAVSIVSFINVAITPFSVTLFNYFCKVKDKEKISNIFSQLCIFAIYLISTAFPAKYILEHFLQEYLNANNSMFFLFAAQMFMTVITSAFVNLYKAQKRQKKYMSNMAFMLIVGFLTNSVLYSLLRTQEAFAIGTLVTSIFWYFISALDFKTIGFSVDIHFLLIIETILFLVCGFSLNSVIGFIVYIICSVFFQVIFMKTRLLEIIKSIKLLLYK